MTYENQILFMHSICLKPFLSCPLQHIISVSRKNTWKPHSYATASYQYSSADILRNKKYILCILWSGISWKWLIKEHIVGFKSRSWLFNPNAQSNDFLKSFLFCAFKFQIQPSLVRVLFLLRFHVFCCFMYCLCSSFPVFYCVNVFYVFSKLTLYCACFTGLLSN